MANTLFKHKDTRPPELMATFLPPSWKDNHPFLCRRRICMLFWFIRGFKEQPRCYYWHWYIVLFPFNLYPFTSFVHFTATICRMFVADFPPHTHTLQLLCPVLLGSYFLGSLLVYFNILCHPLLLICGYAFDSHSAHECPHCLVLSWLTIWWVLKLSKATNNNNNRSLAILP